MKGLEKLTTIRLAEVLTQQGVVPTETITDALYSHDRHGESFVDLLVNGGGITEWDLARYVVEHFQLPFIMASNYDIGEEAKTKIDKEILFEHLIVPLDTFGDMVTVALPILTPYDVLAKIEKQAGIELFPYVGLISENKRVLGELFADFNDWHKNFLAEREKSVRAQEGGDPKKQAGDGSWMNIFDTGDEEVRKSLGDS